MPSASTPSNMRLAAALTFEQVDPAGFADQATDILKAAWRPPCLDYSSEWLRWRVSAPSSLPSLGFAVLAQGMPLGFAGAFGVRVRFGDKEQDVYICSFMSSRPGTPSMVAPLLLRTEARYLKQTGTPFLVFAQVGSAGEQLLAVLDAAKLIRHPIGVYVGHAGMSSSSHTAPAEFVRPETWIAARTAIEPARPIVEMSFDRKRLEYELGDPWGRACAIAYGIDGEPAGVALICNTRTIAKNGPQAVISLHYVRAKTASALIALITLALRDQPRGVAAIPNCAALSSVVLRDARVRATPSRFGCHGFSVNPTGSVLMLAGATDMEVI